MLRLEDLDGDRVQQHYIDRTLEDLEWLGLDWDGTPLLQSSRLSEIQEAALQLLHNGAAYPCTCSRGDIREALSAPHGASRAGLYPGTCVGRYASLADAEGRSHKQAGLRFRCSDEMLGFVDGIHGDYAENLSQTVGDFLILRRDKLPSYQLAVVVDDAYQGVTEIVRGDDLLSSTPRQLALIRALGYPVPKYYHVPLVVDSSGKRLAKRHDALSLRTLRERGVDPRQIVTWVLQSCATSSQDTSGAKGVVEALLDAKQACQHFTIETLNPAVVMVPEKSFGRLAQSQRKG